MDARIDAFGIPASEDTVNFQRWTVVENCRDAATRKTSAFASRETSQALNPSSAAHELTSL